jgi:hypothetical protein
MLVARINVNLRAKGSVTQINSLAPVTLKHAYALSAELPHRIEPADVANLEGVALEQSTAGCDRSSWATISPSPLVGTLTSKINV